MARERKVVYAKCNKKNKKYAEIINSGNYKQLATEFNLIKNNYKIKISIHQKKLKSF